MGGEASDCEGIKPRCLLKAPRPRHVKGPEHNNQLYYLFGVLTFTTSSNMDTDLATTTLGVSTFTTSSNMDTDLATTTPGTGSNTEDALVESSLINTQAAPDDNGVQIVPPPRPRPVLTISARRATMVMTNKANRRSNGSSLPSLRSALPSLMLT